MRLHPILFLAVGLTVAACDDTGGPSADGTLIVSTSSAGNDPDPDGYLLTVDSLHLHPLQPTDTSAIDLPAGEHTLGLIGMADYCSVSPGIPLDVEVPSRDTTSVAFEVTCSATGVRITTTTTGLDFDPDGYRVDVDGVERGVLPSIGTVLTQLDPGSHTIALSGLSPNCTIVGPGSHTLTVVDTEIASIQFAATCTATSGVIEVVVDASGQDVEGEYEAIVDGAGHFPVAPGAPAKLVVPAGAHVVSLVAPANCSVDTDPQPVTVTAGGLIRDTVEVTFPVTCVPGFGTLRIAALTTGPTPQGPYSVWICDTRYDRYACVYYGLRILLGELEPNGTLVAQPRPGTYHLELTSVPANCSVGFSRRTTFTLPNGGTVDFQLTIQCVP